MRILATCRPSTQQAREILGPGKLLCVEQGAILEVDARRARAAARANLAIYLTLPNYLNHWKRLGFTDADFAAGGSDRLIDAVIVWGDEKAIRQRIEEHWQAGADHVCIQVLTEDPKGLPLPEWRELATALLAK